MEILGDDFYLSVHVWMWWRKGQSLCPCISQGNPFVSEITSFCQAYDVEMRFKESIQTIFPGTCDANRPIHPTMTTLVLCGRLIFFLWGVAPDVTTTQLIPVNVLLSPTPNSIASDWCSHLFLSFATVVTKENVLFSVAIVTFMTDLVSLLCSHFFCALRVWHKFSCLQFAFSRDREWRCFLLQLKCCKEQQQCLYSRAHFTLVFAHKTFTLSSASKWNCKAEQHAVLVLDWACAPEFAFEDQQCVKDTFRCGCIVDVLFFVLSI